jgi:serine/threonine protein kinase
MRKELLFRAKELVPGTRWFVHRVLGRGGGGVVFEVYRNERLPEFRGAMKIFSPTISPHENETLLKKTRAHCESWFVQELSLLTRFHHDNIVKVSDFGITADDCPYFVMDLLEGPTLREVMREAMRWRRRDPDAVYPTLRPAEVWKIVREICAGLNYAHTLTPPVVHRDVKPENVILHKQPKGSRVIVLDYGIAHILEAGRTSDVVIGTPRCFSPEMLRGEPITTRTDLYALALLVYELLTLKFPYEVDLWSRKALENAHLNQPPTPPRHHVPSLPASVETALLRALSKDPKDRQAGVLDFLDDISGLLRIADVGATESLDPAAVTDPDVRTPPGARRPEGEGAAATERSKDLEPPSSGHWLEVDRARWGPSSLVPTAAPSELVPTAAPSELREPPTTAANDNGVSEILVGGAPERVRRGPRGAWRVALGMASALLVLGAGGWKAWTAARAGGGADSPVSPAADRPWLDLHAMTEPQPRELVHVPASAATAAPAVPPPPSPPAASSGAARSTKRSATNGGLARSTATSGITDDIVFGNVLPPPDVDDIVFNPSKATPVAVPQLGAGKDHPAPTPSGATIARHP